MPSGDESISNSPARSSHSPHHDSKSRPPVPTAVKRRRDLKLPPGYQSISPPSSGSSSMVSALNAEDVGSSDLWVIRLPIGVKPKHIAGIHLDLTSLNPNSHTDSPLKVGETQVAGAEYDIFAQQIPTTRKLTHSTSTHHTQEVAPEASEVSQFTPLIPDQKKNTQATHIVMAPQRMSKVIFFRRRLPINSIQTTKKSTSILDSNSCRDVKPTKKRSQPDGLELRNNPYGATSTGVYSELSPHPSLGFSNGLDSKKARLS